MTPRHSRFDANHGGRREKSARPMLSLRLPQRVPHRSNLDWPFCKYLAQQVVRQFGLALLRVPGPTGRQTISTMVTCVGTRNWATRKLSEISASCWCFNHGQFWPQDTPNPQKGHNRSTQTKEQIRLICNTITVGPKLSLF
jgi:hypothetical protein